MASNLIYCSLAVMSLVLAESIAGGMQERTIPDRGEVAGTIEQTALSQPLKDQCWEIKSLILAGREDDAETQLEHILHDAGAGEIARMADQILRVSSELESAGYSRNSRDLQTRLVAFLADRPQDRQLSYRTLQEAFFQGQNDFLLDYGRKVKTQDWQSHWLVAEAAADEFIGVMYPGPNMKTREQLKEIARVCTDHYEAAVSQAPDQYIRTRIACGWLSMIGHYRGNFGVDSALLRRQFPTHPAFKCTASPESIHAQAERFRAATRAAMESGEQGQLFDEESRERIVDAYAKQFEEYARIGIPDCVVDRIVKDVAFFFDRGLPIGRIKALDMTRLEELAPMFKWYLWRAILCDMPDEVEQEQIQVQVARIAKCCRDALADPNLPEELLRSVDASMEKFRRQHVELRDNRFVPYFKRVLSGNRFDKSVALLVDGCKDMRANAQDLAGRRLDRDLGRERSFIEAFIQNYGRGAFLNVLNAYSGWDRSLRNPLPDWIIGADSSEVNDYGIFTFLPRLGDPFPADQACPQQ